MPMVVCPNCGEKVTFQGIAGVCPSCASVVTVPKLANESAKKLPPAPRPLSKTPVKVSDIEEIGGEHHEVFEPAFTPTAGNGQLDRGVIIAMAGAGVVVLVFVLFVLFGGPSKTPTPAAPVPAPAPVASAPAHTPEPIAPMPEPVVSAPAVPTTHAVLSLPSWAHLKPQRPPASTGKDSQGVSGVTDAAVNESVSRGANWLVNQFFDGEIANRALLDVTFYSVVHALCTYALLHCGTAITDRRLNIADPFMQSVMEHLKLHDMDTPNATYSHSLRAAALSLFSRPQDSTILRNDLKYLLSAESLGHYTYALPPKDSKPEDVSWDNSNSQYGVLGVWAASQAGLSVPTEYWHHVESHWLKTQGADGGWPYSNQRESTVTMTAAGVTTLSVAAEQETILASAQIASHAAMTRAVGRGLEWLGAEDRILSGGDNGYALYSVERAALATGLKRFGNHDWYRELAAKILASQSKEGQWNGGYASQIETAFHLLFLARGRQALVINKLRFNGEWNNRPRDASKLAEYASMQLEQPFAWGVADFSRDWSDWIDCPLLLISTDKPPTWTDADFAKLRSYTDAGGMILLHNEGATPEMNDFAATLAKQTFPEFELVDLPPDNMIYSVVYPMQNKPPLKAVSNGHRILMVYAPKDITKDWLLRRGKLTNDGSQLGINLFVYAAGKTNFHGRLITPYLPPPLFAAIGTIPIARVQYPSGNWDPEPAAWQRFLRWFQGETSLALTVTPTPIDQLKFPDVPVAVITGAGAANFDRVNTQPLHDFVDKGGIVVIDSVAGDEAFVKSVREKLLPKAFAEGQIQPLDPSHLLLAGTGDGMDPLPKPLLRAFTMETRKEGGLPELDLITLGKGAIIISDIDLTCGLLDTTTWGISGYEPSYSNSIMKNVILWASARYHL